MKKNDLDRIIREKMENFNPVYQPESWDLLEQKLEAEDGGVPAPEEGMIDEVIFHKMHRMERPYQPSHWKLMASRLDLEFALNRHVLWFKAMEVSLIALTLLTFFQYQPSFLEPVQQPVAGQHLTSDPESTGKDPYAVSPDHSGYRKQQTEGTQTPYQPLRREERDLSLPQIGRPEIHSGNFIEPGYEKTPSGLSPLPVIREKVAATTSGALPLPAAPAFSSFEPYGLTYLDAISPTLLSISPNMLSLPLTEPVKRNRYLYVGMMSSTDYNRIITPAITRERIPEYDRFVFGYGGGISVALEMGRRWELETGAIYSSKYYAPPQVLFFQGSVRKGFYGQGIKDIQLNLLQIPVNLRYTLFNRNNWRIYALAGASLQVAFEANYYVADQNGFRGASFVPPPIPSSASSSGVLSLTNLSRGWFEGGTFRENSFITGNLGFGIERYFSDRLSFFVQPIYQHSVFYLNTDDDYTGDAIIKKNFLDRLSEGLDPEKAGLGPYKDRLHSVSILTGVRVRLKR